MEKIKGIDLIEIGHKKTIIGVLLGPGEDKLSHLLMMPGEELAVGVESAGIQETQLTIDEWEKVLWQMDTLQVEVTKGEKLPKIMLRKSQRNIEQSISWAVFRRDNYKCRYCGADDKPLTVDHLITWESGGPSIVDNLVSSCKKCNRIRGNMPYEDWLKSDYYKKVSVGLYNSVINENEMLVNKIKSIPLTVNKRKR